MTKATITTSTKGKNKYLYDRHLKKTLLCHPILFFLAQMKIQGKDPDVWIENTTDNIINIPGFGDSPRKEVAYYLQKLHFLEKAGYFSNISQDKIIKRQLSAIDVEASMSNLKQITFELTDACQLNCYYCGYGDLYGNYDERKKKFMDFSTIQHTIDHLINFVNSPQNISQDQDLFFGFYGGEPLLNFEVIEQTVQYVNQMQFLHNKIRFTITTNGVLLDKYMDFLVQNDFNTFISLDGDEFHSEYRVLKNGKPAYNIIFNNVKSLQEKYPEYFEKRVFFNAVLHNKNNVEAIFKYFFDTFNKKPAILSLNTNGIRHDKTAEFWNTYVNVNESLYHSQNCSQIEQEMFIKLPSIQSMAGFLFRAIDFHYDSYMNIFYSQKEPDRYPSDTCLPFSKKVFLTVNGKILPCERIGQSFELGYVTPDGIQLDFQEISDKYNRWFDRIRKQCQACYKYDQCIQCIFYLDLKGEKTLCHSFHDSTRYSSDMASLLDYFEKRPALLSRIIKEVFFG